MHEQHPSLPWLFPIVVPVAAYDDQAAESSLLDYIESQLRNAGGEALAQRFRQYWAEHICIVLLDGLDEVADAGRRITCSRRVGDLVASADGNRAIITSRPIGYSVCRLSVPAAHLRLLPFSTTDIALFVRRWHSAFEIATRPENPRVKEAERAAAD
jgi:hypothetical protein